MWLWVQVVLGVAGVVFIIACALAVPSLIQLRREFNRMATATEEARADLKVFVEESRIVLFKINSLATQLETEMNEVQQVVSRVRSWTDQADRIATVVGTAIQRPLLGGVRSLQLLRTGIAAFIYELFSRHPDGRENRRQTNDREF